MKKNFKVNIEVWDTTDYNYGLTVLPCPTIMGTISRDKRDPRPISFIIQDDSNSRETNYSVKLFDGPLEYNGEYRVGYGMEEESTFVYCKGLGELREILEKETGFSFRFEDDVWSSKDEIGEAYIISESQEKRWQQYAAKRRNIG